MAMIRGNTRGPRLSETDLTLLAAGPWACGLDLRAPEAQHDRLRRLWRAHEDAVRVAAARRGLAAPWFVERDAFVRDVRGD